MTIQGASDIDSPLPGRTLHSAAPTNEPVIRADDVMPADDIGPMLAAAAAGAAARRDAQTSAFRGEADAPTPSRSSNNTHGRRQARWH